MSNGNKALPCGMLQAAAEQRILRLTVIAMRLDNVATVDAIRREIAEAIGGEGPQRWLTIDFTADPRWL